MTGERRVIDVRALPGTRESLVVQDGGLFPVLCLADSGAIVAVLRGGAGHLGLTGRIEVARSLDGGLTWSPPAVVADSDRDDRNPALGRAHGGALLLAYQRQGSYDQEGVYRPDHRSRDGSRPVDVMITRSIDAGLTWEAPAPLAAAETGSPFGKIVPLADGTSLLSCYVRSEGVVRSHVLRSTDGGRSWGERSLVARHMNETALLPLSGGEVLAVMRAADHQQALFCARSADGGRSWTQPRQVTAPHQHPADLIELASGDLLLTYGNRTPPYRIEGLLSRDRGETWDGPLLLFSGALHGYAGRAGRTTDLGYPSSVVRRGLGATVYYYDPSCGRRGESSHLRPPYLATGYRAIAVTWREEELIEAVRDTR